jgi:excisionase family DNA binding protein
MKKLLTVAQLAEWLQVPKSWVYEKSRTGGIPSIKLGGHLRFDSAEVERLLTDPRSLTSEYEREKRRPNRS